MNGPKNFTGQQPPTGGVFMGELMTCAGCKKQKRSNPKVESGWTMLEIDELHLYYCPQCFKKLLAGHGQIGK